MLEDVPFGSRLKLSVRGASHAPALGFTLANFPAGFALDRAALAAFMERRAPGRDELSTARREPDEVEFIAGIGEDGRTDGSPLVGRIANRDARPYDYGAERTVPRPGHADFGQWIETGRIPTGGGANSGRLTAPLCAAGGICLQFLAQRGVRVAAQIESIGGRRDGFDETILAAKRDGDSVGGVVRCEVSGVAAGLGGALFAGLESGLSAALFAIPGVKGVEFGDGFAAANLRGSENDDPFAAADGAVSTVGNRHGGILGGRTSGMPIVFRVAFKPTPTIFKPLASVDLAAMSPATCAMKGRHDPCIVRRAVPVVEAMAAFAVADLILATEAASPRIVLTLTGKTLDEDFAQFASQRYFCDAVELRVDLLAPSERARAAEFPSRVRVPVVLTFRRRRDGGGFDGDESERIDFFRSALAAPSEKCSGVGVLECSSVRVFECSSIGENGISHSSVSQLEHSNTRTLEHSNTFPLSHSPASSLEHSNTPTLEHFSYVDFESDFRVPELDALARAHGARIIRSLHKFDGPVADVAARCRELRGATDEIPKIAFMPNSALDVARLFEETRGFDDFPHILCAMGAAGIASRALAARTHSLFTYASVGGLGQIGHVSPRDLVRDYRIRSATRRAALYGVTGWPLVFTRSPELHNAAFAAAAEDAVMVPFPSRTAEEAIAFMRSTGMRGLAVTYPHKQSVMPLLDEIFPEAKAIGAVNTVALVGGRLVGHNTDAAGFADAVSRFAGGPLAGRRAAIVGAGGAARAVAYALKRLGASACVFNRTPAKADALAAEFGFASSPLGAETADEFAKWADVVVQCAAPGGDPGHFDPLAFHTFTGRELVYDLVYEPALTPTLARAKAAGCKIENGFSMLVAQAREQRRIWFGR